MIISYLSVQVGFSNIADRRSGGAKLLGCTRPGARKRLTVNETSQPLTVQNLLHSAVTVHLVVSPLGPPCFAGLSVWARLS
jgi:hypothetical protein